MVFTALDDSIEGQTIGLQARKFLIYPPQKRGELGMVFPFKLSIFGIATINVELTPKRYFLSEKSALNLGDELRAESVNGFARKTVRKPQVTAATGTHQAQFSEAKGGAYAHIQVPQRSIAQKKASTQ